MGTEPQRAVLERVGDSVTNWREDWPRLEKRDRRCARFRFRAWDDSSSSADLDRAFLAARSVV